MACSLPLDWDRFAGFQRPGQTQRHGITSLPYAIGAPDCIMRGEKINETLVFGCRREVELVDKAGKRRF